MLGLLIIATTASARTPTHYTWKIDGDPSYAGDSAWPEDGSSARLPIPLDGLKPGAHTAAITVAFDDGYVTPPATVKFFVEPDSKASYAPPPQNTLFELINEAGDIIFSDFLQPVDGAQGQYSVYLPLDNMGHIEDSTFRMRLKVEDSLGITTFSDPDAADVLYRQKGYYDWLSDVAPGQPTGFDEDPDNDGRTNLLEWFLKSDPANTDAGPALSVDVRPEDIVFSWVGRGGINLYSPGFYTPSFGGEFGLQGASQGLDGFWSLGLPEAGDGSSVFETRTTPLDGGLERVEVVIPKDSPEAPEGSYFLRWAPSPAF